MTGIPNRLSDAAREGSVVPEVGESSSSAPANLPEHALLRREASPGNNRPQISAAQVVNDEERKKLIEFRALESERNEQAIKIAEIRLMLESQTNACTQLEDDARKLAGLEDDAGILSAVDPTKMRTSMEVIGLSLREFQKNVLELTDKLKEGEKNLKQLNSRVIKLAPSVSQKGLPSNPSAKFEDLTKKSAAIALGDINLEELSHLRKETKEGIKKALKNGDLHTWIRSIREDPVAFLSEYGIKESLELNFDWAKNYTSLERRAGPKTMDEKVSEILRSTKDPKLAQEIESLSKLSLSNSQIIDKLREDETTKETIESLIKKLEYDFRYSGIGLFTFTESSIEYNDGRIALNLIPIKQLIGEFKELPDNSPFFYMYWLSAFAGETAALKLTDKGPPIAGTSQFGGCQGATGTNPEKPEEAVIAHTHACSMATNQPYTSEERTNLTEQKMGEFGIKTQHIRRISQTNQHGGKGYQYGTKEGEGEGVNVFWIRNKDQPEGKLPWEPYIQHTEDVRVDAIRGDKSVPVTGLDKLSLDSQTGSLRVRKLVILPPLE